MAAFVDATVKEIDDRLRELRDELSKLEAARAALTGGGPPRRGPGRPRGSRTAAGSRRRPGRPGGRRGAGTRANQALELVRGKPGITIPELAEQMKIAPNYLYRVMPKLVSAGQVRREGQGWHPIS